MTDDDLDLAYTSLCRTMTRLGEANVPPFLARLALLGLARLGSGPEALRLIAEAAVDLIPPPDGGSPAASPISSAIPYAIPSAFAPRPAGR